MAQDYFLNTLILVDYRRVSLGRSLSLYIFHCVSSICVSMYIYFTVSNSVFIMPSMFTVVSWLPVPLV